MIHTCWKPVFRQMLCFFECNTVISSSAMFLLPFHVEVWTWSIIYVQVLVTASSLSLQRSLCCIIILHLCVNMFPLQTACWPRVAAQTWLDFWPVRSRLLNGALTRRALTAAGCVRPYGSIDFSFLKVEGNYEGKKYGLAARISEVITKIRWLLTKRNQRDKKKPFFWSTGKAPFRICSDESAEIWSTAGWEWENPIKGEESGTHREKGR